MNRLPFDFLLGVLLLFQFEHVLVEIELQILVGVVDAHLLKTVFLEIFESENIQYVDRQKTITLVDCLVHAVHQPAEQRTFPQQYNIIE